MSGLSLNALFGILSTLVRALTALIRDTTIMWWLHWKRGYIAKMRVLTGRTKATFVNHLKTERRSVKPSTRSNIQPAVVALGQDQ